MTPDDLVERVALAFCGKDVPCKMCRNDAKKAIALVLEEAAKVAAGNDRSATEYYRGRVHAAAAIRGMIPTGTIPAQNDDADSK